MTETEKRMGRRRVRKNKHQSTKTLKEPDANNLDANNPENACPVESRGISCTERHDTEVNHSKENGVSGEEKNDQDQEGAAYEEDHKNKESTDFNEIDELKEKLKEKKCSLQRAYREEVQCHNEYTLQTQKIRQELAANEKKEKESFTANCHNILLVKSKVESFESSLDEAIHSQDYRKFQQIRTDFEFLEDPNPPTPMGLEAFPMGLSTLPWSSVDSTCLEGNSIQSPQGNTQNNRTNKPGSVSLAAQSSHSFDKEEKGQQTPTNLLLVTMMSKHKIREEQQKKEQRTGKSGSNGNQAVKTPPCERNTQASNDGPKFDKSETNGNQVVMAPPCERNAQASKDGPKFDKSETNGNQVVMAPPCERNAQASKDGPKFDKSETNGNQVVMAPPCERNAQASKDGPKFDKSETNGNQAVMTPPCERNAQASKDGPKFDNSEIKGNQAVMAAPPCERNAQASNDGPKFDKSETKGNQAVMAAPPCERNAQASKDGPKFDKSETNGNQAVMAAPPCERNAQASNDGPKFDKSETKGNQAVMAAPPCERNAQASKDGPKFDKSETNGNQAVMAPPSHNEDTIPLLVNSGGLLDIHGQIQNQSKTPCKDIEINSQMNKIQTQEKDAIIKRACDSFKLESLSPTSTAEPD